VIHVVSLPHTLLEKRYEWCAFTAKTWRFAKMMKMAGNPVTLYGPDVVDAETRACVADYVAVIDAQDRQAWFGQPQWPAHHVFDRWDAGDPCWTETNKRYATEIRERWSPGDVVALIGGRCQEQLLDHLADLNALSVEWGIGYVGTVSRTHKVYESYAWMHHLAGRHGDDDIKYFDTVIPNCFDLDDFTPRHEQPEEPYLLFMARPITRKGTAIVAAIAERAGIPVKIAGQPGEPIPGTEYIGLLTGAQKYHHLANATALLSPSVYLEPFGGVAVEAMISGTPVIATDWGAYTETVQHDVTGFRCRTLGDFLTAVEQAPHLDRRVIADTAARKYGLAEGARQYQQFFTRLDTLYADGWYTASPA
jgi:glycosyltransferase involved in cell wall biosynthesis